MKLSVRRAVPIVDTMLRHAFHDHPASVGETYGEHLRRALRISLRLFAAAGAALVHAVVPGWFTTTASETVTGISDEIRELRVLQSLG